MSVYKCDQAAYGFGVDILAGDSVKLEESWENWTPDATIELRNSDDIALGQSNKLEFHVPASPFEIQYSSLWHDETPLLNLQDRKETSWTEEQTGVGIDVGDDHDSQFEKRTFDFIAGDILSDLNAGPTKRSSDPPQTPQVVEELSTPIVEQLSQIQSVPSLSVIRHGDSPNSPLGKSAGSRHRIPASDAAHIAALESDAAKLAEKNRKSRERSLRTRTRNAERMTEIENGVRRLKSENTGIKSILDGSHSDLESLLLAVLPTCVQQFENELARSDSPGVRRCAAYLVATVQRLSQNYDRSASYAKAQQEKICSRTPGDVGTLQSAGATCNPKTNP